MDVIAYSLFYTIEIVQIPNVEEISKRHIRSLRIGQKYKKRLFLQSNIRHF